MTDTVGNIRTDKCTRVCENKTSEGYCMTTACLYPESATISNSSWTCGASKIFGECDSCTHREVCKFKDDFEDAKNKIHEKNSKLPILRVQCTFYETRSCGINYINTWNGDNQFLKPPYEVTCEVTNAMKGSI